MTKFQAGDTVTWKASGKGARVDGVNGKMVTGVVEMMLMSGLVVVKGNYRSMFYSHIVPARRLRLVKT